jgi:hypothetical protein
MAEISSGSYFRFRTGLSRKAVLITIVAGVAQLATVPRLAGEVFFQNSKPANATRPCENVVTRSRPSKAANKNAKKKLEDSDANAAGACLEVRSATLEIQEYLQAYGREQKWNLTDEHIAEDAWTFTRKLEREELLRYTKKDANTDRVNWTSGLVFLQVKTLELDEKFVRVQVSARFQGYGQNGDRFAPQKESWPMSSNSTLENQLISVLETHYKGLQ